jgi:signal transduction histidine kinase
MADTQRSAIDFSQDRHAPSGTMTLSLRDIAEHVFHSLSLGVIVFDPELHVILRNQAATIMLPPGNRISDVLAEVAVESKYQNWGIELRQAIESRGQTHFDGITCRVSASETRMLNMVCTPMDDVATGRSIGGLMVIEDVTARLTMERRLAVSERLAAVGKLAAKVAHELNNPLDGIMRYLNLAIRVSETPGTPAEPEKVVRYLTEARKGLTRMVQILGELLEFSRSSYGTYEEANVNRYVEDAVNAMQDKALRKGVNIVCRMDGVMPGVRVGSNLFQVYCNLIKNAVDAMPDGGTLTITTAQINREVVVAFEDTGTGLPEDPERIFQPFFTTKPSGQGTGLGLAICKDIIEKYNGRILAENRPEGGARFTVVVPIEGGAVAAAR